MHDKIKFFLEPLGWGLALFICIILMMVILFTSMAAGAWLFDFCGWSSELGAMIGLISLFSASFSIIIANN